MKYDKGSLEATIIKHSHFLEVADAHSEFANRFGSPMLRGVVEEILIEGLRDRGLVGIKHHFVELFMG